MKLAFGIATEDDAAELAMLHQEAARALTLRHGRGPWSKVGGGRPPSARSKFERVVVARARGTIHGTLTLVTKKPWAIDVSYFTPVKKALYLISMAVRPERQGQGIGRELLGEAERVARAWPANAIRLDAWDAAVGVGAGGFYARCGYREAGRMSYRGAPLIYYESVFD